MRVPYFTPVLCSACFAQQPDVPHVDFESAWDGPVVNNDGTPYSVDELMICERCLRDAVKLLPLSHQEASRDAQLAMLEERYEEAMEYALRLQNAVTSLQDALDAKLAPVVEARPPKPRRVKASA